MQGAADWLFVAALYGTLGFGIVLGAVAWRTRPGARTPRLLAVAGAWLLLCAVAGTGRLATDDGYYSPNHVTYWAHSSTSERETAALLLLATGAAGLVLLAAARRHGVRAGIAAALIGAGWVLDVAMIVFSIGLGLH